MSQPLQWVRAFDRRHPLWWDLGLAVAVAIVTVIATSRWGPISIGLLLVADGAVVFRRRHPFLALLVAAGAVITGAIIYALVGVGHTWAYLPIWVLLFNVGLRQSGRRGMWGWAVIAVTAVAAFLAPTEVISFDVVDRLRSLLPVAAVGTAALLAGAQVNSRRAALETQRQETARAAVVAERSRIAQEMHDIIGHNLSVITSLANGGTVAARTSPQDAARVFESIGEVSRSSVREVRQVLAVLRDDQSREGAALSPQPGLADVGALIDSVRAAGLTVHVDGIAEPDGLSGGHQLAVYRIVQESLTNVLRHSGRTAAAHVEISRERDDVIVHVRNDHGTAPTASHHSSTAGHGILGMRERAEAYGGSVHAGPADTGWQVRARIPLERNEQ